MFLSLFHFEELIFVVLSIGVVLVNKYVLSTLHFTIPTVFQGWQTMVCVVLLSALMKWSRFRLDVQLLDRRTLARLTFPLLCFSLSNVAGSKALADLPVAIFLAGTNLVPAGLVLLNGDKTPSASLKMAGCVTLFTSVLTLFVLYPGHEFGWVWLGVHVASHLAQILSLAKLRLAFTTNIYYCNFSSVLFLLPLSIYLQEASSALNHAKKASTEFFLGCLLSGILGTGVQLATGNLQDKKSLPLFQGVSKIIACTCSLILFPTDINSLAWLSIILNLVTGCLIFVEEETSSEKVVCEVAVV